MTASRSAAPWENPLVPHAKLRAIYATMVQGRLLEQHEKVRAADSIRGSEACRAVGLACLEPGDLLSDPSRSPAADLSRGQPRRAPASGVLRLPADPDAQQQIHTALGAAHALKLQRSGRVVLAYTTFGALSRSAWKAAFCFAGSGELPLLLVVLPSRPGAGTHAREGLLSDKAHSWGVPGIAVDAADAVALFRVLSESVMRARAADGPTLIECISWRPAGARVRGASDVISATRDSLLARGAASELWVERVSSSFLQRLARASGPHARALLTK